jgi:hypothetical protein
MTRWVIHAETVVLKRRSGLPVGEGAYGESYHAPTRIRP